MTTKDQGKLLAKLRTKLETMEDLIKELGDGKFVLSGMKKVVLIDPNAGFPSDVCLIRDNYVKSNVIYSLNAIEISGFYTYLELVEYPGVWFNSCNFELA